MSNRPQQIVPKRRFSLTDDLDRTVTANLHRATRLRQLILAAVFAGRFTGQFDIETFLELPMVAEAPGEHSSGRSAQRSVSGAAKGGPA
jgi:hypothetical protein